MRNIIAVDQYDDGVSFQQECVRCQVLFDFPIGAADGDDQETPIAADFDLIQCLIHKRRTRGHLQLFKLQTEVAQLVSNRAFAGQLFQHVFHRRSHDQLSDFAGADSSRQHHAVRAAAQQFLFGLGVFAACDDHDLRVHLPRSNRDEHIGRVG